MAGTPCLSFLTALRGVNEGNASLRGGGYRRELDGHLFIADHIQRRGREGGIDGWMEG